MLCSALVLLLCSIDIVAARIRRSTRPVVDDYIVILKKGIDLSSHIEQLSDAVSVKYTYNATLNGYCASLTAAALDAVRSDPNVEYVTEDSFVSADYEPNHLPTTDPGPLALTDVDGIRRPGRAENLGQGIDIYVVDSGIYIDHTDFGGRASWGATFGDYPDQDLRGHGTFVASLAVGTQYGLASAANVIAVKVWDKPAEGRISNVIAAFEWIVDQVSKSKKPSVVNLSISHPPDQALRKAVSAAIEAGIHFVGAAGNRKENVNNNFISTSKASFSNFGREVDVFYLGVSVRGADITGPYASKVTSGTSNSCAYVAGILAIALSRLDTMTPPKLHDALREHAKPLVTGQPLGTTNLLAQIFPK